MSQTIRQYYLLTKPGIIRGNLFTAAAGYLLGAQGRIDIFVLVGLAGGTACVVAAACVFNNYIDRRIDAKMPRTQKRASVTGAISHSQILGFGAVLFGLGFAVLIITTNWQTTFMGVLGFFFYIGPYSFFKRRSPVGTLVGSVSGAAPPVAGYVAATASFDQVALWLFLILMFWQMAHFYAIAIYRQKEYEKAGLPLLPIVRGVATTKRRIIGYMVAFLLASVGLYISSNTLGLAYLVVALGVGLFWLRTGAKGFNQENNTKWAERVFVSSLLVLVTFSVSISIGGLLP